MVRTRAAAAAEIVVEQSDNDTELLRETFEAEVVIQKIDRCENPKKRGNKINLDDSSQMEDLRRLMKEAFRGAYQAEDDNLDPFSKQLKAVFLKFIDSFPDNLQSDFFNELRFRLNLIVEDCNDMHKRKKVYKMLVKAGLNVYTESSKMDLLQFLYNYATSLVYAEDHSVRCNICALVGILFELWPVMKHGDKNEHAMPNDYRNGLYGVLISRQYDKHILVRCEVLKACKYIQDIPISNDFKIAIKRGPKDIIYMGLRDVCPECRLAALETLNLDLKCTEHVKTLIEIATCDRSNKVRISAITTLGKVKPTSIDKALLLDLLQSVLFAIQKPIRAASQTYLLMSWIKILADGQRRKCKQQEKAGGTKINLKNDCNHGLGAGAFILMSRLPWATSDDVVARIGIVILDTTRLMLGRGRPFSVSDLFMSMSNDAVLPEPILHRNYKTLVEESMSSKALAEKCFYWRCMIEYAYTKTGTDATGTIDRHASLHRLAPTMKAMCELAKELSVKALPTNMNEEHDCNDLEYSNYCQIALLQILKSIPFLEKDECGLEAWRLTLEELLFDFTLKKYVTDNITIHLVGEHYKNDAMGALDTVTSIAASLVDKSVNPDATLMNETLSAPRAPLSPAEEEVITNYCMQLVNSILKTGVFKALNPIILDKYENLVHRCLKSRDEEVRSWAIEATGIVGGLEAKIAQENINMILRAINLDCSTIKCICLDAICDWCVIYGYEKVNDWIKEPAELTELFESFLEPSFTDEKVGFKATECSAKLLLLGVRVHTQTHFVSLTASLILKLFHPSSSKNSALKACLAQFFITFSTNRRSNQFVLVYSFWHIAERVKKLNLAVGPLAARKDINIAKCLTFICNWTKRTLLLKENERNVPCAHHALFEQIISHMLANPCDSLIPSYCQCLSLLEIENFRNNQVLDMYEDLFDFYHTLVEDDGERPKHVVEVKKLMKKLYTMGERYNEENGIPTVLKKYVKDKKKNKRDRPEPLDVDVALGIKKDIKLQLSALASDENVVDGEENIANDEDEEDESADAADDEQSVENAVENEHNTENSTDVEQNPENSAEYNASERLDRSADPDEDVRSGIEETAGSSQTGSIENIDGIEKSDIESPDGKGSGNTHKKPKSKK